MSTNGEIATDSLRVGLLAVGDKGYQLAADLAAYVRVSHIVTYAQSTSRFAVDEFADLARRHGASLELNHRPTLDFASEVDVLFTVGWQYLLPDPPANLVVLHDSLLPRYRGFAPTVNALVAGDRTLGVTALLPGRGVDDGPIVAQSSVEVAPAIRIAEALEVLRKCYLAVARQICAELKQGRLLAALARPQDPEGVSYSQWRDEFDYLVDWSLGADEVLRHIRAVGAPYAGAVAFTSRGDRLVLDEAEIGHDVVFVGRTPGKVHALAPGRIDVVCGYGVLSIIRWRAEPSWAPKLRTRFVDVAVATLLLMQHRTD